MDDMPHTNKKGFKFLYELETSLRKFIIEKLEEKSSTENLGGWMKLVSVNIIKKCESRRQRELKKYPYQDLGSDQILDYSDFHDLKEIIISNWDIFSNFFGDKNMVNNKFGELEPIRHTIAHNRKLSEKELNRLKIFCNDIGRCLSP